MKIYTLTTEETEAEQYKDYFIEVTELYEDYGYIIYQNIDTETLGRLQYTDVVEMVDTDFTGSYKTREAALEAAKKTIDTY